MLIAYTGTYLLLEMSHHNYIPFRCLTSNILKENWVSFFFFFRLLFLLPVMCEKPIPTTLQAAGRWKVSGLVKKLAGKLSGLDDGNDYSKSSRAKLRGQTCQLDNHLQSTPRGVCI